MSKLADALRERRIYNTHGLLLEFGKPGQDYAICFTPHSRQTMSTFGVFLYCPRGRLEERFDYMLKQGRAEAKAFAQKHFGITEWAADPTDRTTLIPKYVREAAVAAVKAAS